MRILAKPRSTTSLRFEIGAIGALCAFTVFACTIAVASAQDQTALTGTVSDSLGGRVASATVALLHDGQQTAQTQTNQAGEFRFSNVPDGRYQVRAEASGFEARTTRPLFVGGTGRPAVDIVLAIGPLQQAVVVSAAATELPASQTGAPITVIDSQTLQALEKPDVLEALRLVPGAQVVQTGQRGGATSLSIRGGNSNFTKVLFDGVAVNDIGGAFDFAQTAVAGVERIEVLRQSNTVLYGSDALSGVVNIITRRGTTRMPQLDLSADAGNFATRRASAAIGGAARRFDYFSEYAYFDTDNATPNSAYRNGTYAGRFGVAAGHGTDLSGTIRRADTKFGSANGFDLYRLADDSVQKNAMTYASVTANSQMTDRWQATLRFGNTDFRTNFVNPTPSGEPFDPFGFGANYLGRTVTLTGANGYSVTGRGVLDFTGTYPSLFESRTQRRTLFASATYHAGRDIDVSGGGRVEREQASDNPDGKPDARRKNGGTFVEVRGTILRRTYVTAGIGVEHNGAFGNAMTPRLSIATYLRNPSASAVGETKVSFNYGRGIEAPSVFQQQNALSALVPGASAALEPERSRSIDIGVEQVFGYGRARVRTAYFHNEYGDLLEFLSRTQLPAAGVPAAVAAAAESGAYVNSQSFRAQGIETSFEAAAGPYVRMNASYTYLDAKVTKAFSAAASFNPSFPDIPIGAFAPLVGARPFRRPSQSGSVMVSVIRGPATVSFAGYFSGKRDDSTFLSDAFFGNSLLLPNRDLEPAYQKLDLSGSYHLHPRASVYVTIENILDKKYDATFGFPSLPRAGRVGVRIRLGGDSAPVP